MVVGHWSAIGNMPLKIAAFKVSEDQANVASTRGGLRVALAVSGSHSRRQGRPYRLVVSGLATSM
jgi:hypothetical protein